MPPVAKLSPYQTHVAAWKNCRRCGLCHTRNHVVLTRGTLPCDVLLVGEAPGRSEDILGQPFVGPAGKLLDRMLADAIGELAVENRHVTFWQPPTIAFTNLVACQPIDAADAEGRKKPEPSAAEIAACRPRLEQFILLTSSNVIIAVGALAKKHADKDNWAEKYRARIFHVYHPSYILHQDINSRGILIDQTVIGLRDAIAEAEIPF